MASPTHGLPAAFAGAATPETFPHPAWAKKPRHAPSTVGVSDYVSSQTVTALDREALETALAAKVPFEDHWR